MSTATLPGRAAAGAGVKAPAWLKDRKVQLAMAVGAAAGLVVLLRRGLGGGGAAGGTDAGSGSTPQSITPAVMDSSGTDVYNAISSLGQGWQNDLRQYQSTLDDLGTQIGKNTSGIDNLNTTIGQLGQTKPPDATVTPPVLVSVPPGEVPTEPIPVPSVPIPATPVPKPVIKPPTVKPKPVAKKPAAKPVYATVTKFAASSPAWSSTMSGIAKHYGVSVTTLKKLNPKVTNVNVIHAGQQIRVK